VFQQHPSPSSICSELSICAKNKATLTQLRASSEHGSAQIAAARKSMPAPKPSRPTDGKPASNLTGVLVQLADVHLDVKCVAGVAVLIMLTPNCRYQPGTLNVCNEPLCCRGGSGTAGIYGAYHCDTPLSLLEDALDAVQALVPKFDYLIWSGDSPPHVSSPYCRFQLCAGSLY
jgi:hypothetical protein